MSVDWFTRVAEDIAGAVLAQRAEVDRDGLRAIILQAVNAHCPFKPDVPYVEAFAPCLLTTGPNAALHQTIFAAALAGLCARSDFNGDRDDRLELAFDYANRAIEMQEQQTHNPCEEQTIKALKNSGIDTTCGACMEIAFTGITTNAHTCPFNKHRTRVERR